MREIKFRRPLLDSNGKCYAFQYWGFIWLNEGDGRFAAPRFPSATGDRMGDDQEYIGIKDQDGVEIYAGDKVRDDKDSESIVEWDDIMTGWFPFHRSLQPFLRTYEVIGNIYENPELLEGR